MLRQREEWCLFLVSECPVEAFCNIAAEFNMLLLVFAYWDFSCAVGVSVRLVMHSYTHKHTGRLGCQQPAGQDT